MHHIAIFASGSGTNAQKIIEHFNNHATIKIALVLSNKEDAGVLQIAETYAIPSIVVKKERLQDENYMSSLLIAHGIDFIVLAGFLLLVPPFLIQQFPKRIVNIHPALLPKYGGKGMYGKFVHQAVIANGEIETGITIHFASEHYDEGDIIFQEKVSLSKADNVESIATKVQQLEHKHFAEVIEQLIVSQLNLS